MNPTVVVGDSATSVLFVVVQIGRQDHRFGWWLGFGASHANSVAGLSSVPPGVGNSPPNEHPASHVNERQAASLGLGSHHGDDLVDTLWSRALVRSPGVHLCSLGTAGARWRRLNADPFQEARQLGAGAMSGRGWRWLVACLRYSRVRRVVNVNRPLVAVLRHDAAHHLVKRVATLSASPF
jgi:hypothetical protein